jgi:hypothetical protein
VLHEAIAAHINIPEKHVAWFAVSPCDDPDLVGVVAAGDSDGVFTCAEVFLGKAGWERVIPNGASIPPIGVLMADELESESLTGPSQGVEILNEEIHFSDVAHDSSFCE